VNNLKTIFDDILREDVLGKFKELDELAGEYLSENPVPYDNRHSGMRETLSGMCMLFVIIMRVYKHVDNPKYYMIRLMSISKPAGNGKTSLKFTIDYINNRDKEIIIKEARQLLLKYPKTEMDDYCERIRDALSIVTDCFWNNEDYGYLRNFILWNIDRINTEEERNELYGTFDFNCNPGKDKHLNREDEANTDNSSDQDALNAENMKRECELFLHDYSTPEKIKEYLDRFIIGQDDAKKLISLSVFQHYNRILHEEADIPKFNVLMIGPSGCGKTEIIRRLKEIVGLPVITVDFSGIVSTPYKGRNKEDELIRLYKEARGDLYRAERGIIFLDEFDKICKNDDMKRGYSNSDELMGQLLSMMEGTVIDTAQRSHADKHDEDIVIDTKNILFVCLGSFEGLDEIILRDSKRLENERRESGGFGMTPIKSSGKITSEDVEIRHLIKFGIKPELAGRLCNLAVLSPIDRDMMIRIMTEAEDSAIRLFQKEFLLDDGIEIRFTQDALEAIAEKGLECGVGARAINSVIRESLADIMYEAPSMEKGTIITVTGEMVLNNLSGNA